MWGPQGGEQAWPGGPHPGQIAALNEQARRDREAWDALSAEEQQASIVREAERQATALHRRAEAEQQAKRRAAELEGEIARLLTDLAAAGNPGLQDRTMTVARSGLFSREFPVTVGKAWPCGNMNWRQQESSSTPPTSHYPTGVDPNGTLVPMNRLLASETRPTMKRRSGVVLFSGVQVTEPVDAGPHGLGKAATDPRMRQLVHATLSRQSANLK